MWKCIVFVYNRLWRESERTNNQMAILSGRIEIFRIPYYLLLHYQQKKNTALDHVWNCANVSKVHVSNAWKFSNKHSPWVSRVRVCNLKLSSAKKIQTDCKIPFECALSHCRPPFIYSRIIVNIFLEKKRLMIWTPSFSHDHCSFRMSSQYSTVVVVVFVCSLAKSWWLWYSDYTSSLILCCAQYLRNSKRLTACLRHNNNWVILP